MVSKWLVCNLLKWISFDWHGMVCIDIECMTLKLCFCDGPLLICIGYQDTYCNAMGWNGDGMKLIDIQLAWPEYIGLAWLGMQMQWNGTDEYNEFEANAMYWTREDIGMEWNGMTRMVSMWLVCNLLTWISFDWNGMVCIDIECMTLKLWFCDAPLILCTGYQDT